MKRITTLTAAFVIMAAMTASANIGLHNSMYEVRSFTMGGEKINNIIKDQGNIWLYPQTIAMYADQAEGVWDDNLSNEFARLGVNFQFGSNNPFTLGVYIDQTGNSPFNPYSGYSWGRTPFYNSLNNNRQFNVFYGRNLSGNPFGVHLQVFNSKNKFEDAATLNPQNFEATLSSFSADFGLTTGGGAWDWAAGVMFSTFTDERANFGGASTTWTEPDGSLNVHFRGRRWFVRSSKVTWVGHGSFGYGKTGIKWNVATGSAAQIGDWTDEWKHTMLELGFGLNYTPSSKVLAVLDFGVDYSKDDRTLSNTTATGATPSETNTKSVSLPPYYSLGVDAEVLSWLDFRMGASNQRSNRTSESASGKATDNQNNVGTYVGFGFHWGDLTVDTYVNPNFFTEGPYFISGDDTLDMFAYLAATLHFGN